MSTRFELPPTGLFARWLPLFVGGVMPLAVATLLFFVSPAGETEWLQVWPVLVLMPLVGVLIGLDIRTRVVELQDGRLRVRRWPIPRSFDVAAIDLAGARIVDLDREHSLRPMLNIVGSRMPGFRSGWFVLRDRRRAYVLTRSGNRAALLPLRDGRLLMLGVERPDALLEALRDAAATPGMRTPGRHR
jgi:hypothetical protein